jgi:hypothetical protein
VREREQLGFVFVVAGVGWGILGDRFGVKEGAVMDDIEDMVGDMGGAPLGLHLPKRDSPPPSRRNGDNAVVIKPRRRIAANPGGAKDEESAVSACTDDGASETTTTTTTSSAAAQVPGTQVRVATIRLLGCHSCIVSTPLRLPCNLSPHAINREIAEIEQFVGFV